MNKSKAINIIRQHKNELAKNFGVLKIGIFGSYSRGEQTRESDIDIVVEIKNPDLFLLVAVKNYLQDLLKSEVDIVRLRDRMNESLKRRIMSDVIYV